MSRKQSAISYPSAGNEWCLQIEEDSFWFRHRNQCLVETMRLFPPPGTLFDIGGGNGFVALALQRAGIETVLVEPGVQGALNARKRGLDPVICSTLQDAGFRARSLPAVGLFDVLEHIEDDLGFLKTVKNLLAPGGRIYLTVPAYQFLWSAEDEYGGHFRRYTLASLAKRLTAAGFALDFATCIFAFLPLPIFFFRVLPSRLGFRKSLDFEQEKREHRAKRGIGGRLLDSALGLELGALRRRRKIPFGGSCLAVASAY